MKKSVNITNQVNPSLASFANLYHDTVEAEYQVIPEKLQETNEKLTQKYLPKDTQFYPIYSDRPNSYQADLMFEPYVNSKGEKILQAILCVININTKYAFARTVDYVKNVKAMDERNWNDKSTRVLLNNKDSSLVLRSFRRILQDMSNEDEVLDEFPALKGHTRFKIDRLYVDDGSEFKGYFGQFCEENKIWIHPFRPQEGSKRRLGIVERFNRTLRRLMDKQINMKGKMTIDKLIPYALDLYNRYLNHRGIADFFRRNVAKGKKVPVMRFFPAMMLMPGMESEYVDYMREITKSVDEHYADRLSELKPGTTVRYLKRNDNPFLKNRGGTMSEPVQLVGRHSYDYPTGKSTRSGEIRQRMQGPSFNVSGTTQRFLPYELEVQGRPSKKNKISMT
jgi:hypothetical protein